MYGTIPNMEPVSNDLQETGTVLPSLPFKYERTSDPDIAQFSERRISPVRVVGGQENEPRSDEAILERVRKDREARDWFTEEYWRVKGEPHEQVEFEIDDKNITLYNWNNEASIDEQHIKRLESAILQLVSHFPNALDKIRYILIDDKNDRSAFGDSQKYPFNGEALPQWNAFRFLARGLSLEPHRISSATNIEGTFVHEASHLNQGDFEGEWVKKNKKWEYCIDHPEEWELRLPPDGEAKKWFNKQTGEMAPQSMFPLQPEECVTYYSKLSPDEDICESVVAYIYDPELLKRVSPDKFSILENKDAKRALPQVTAKKIPSDEIKLPEIKPETVYYYIREPEATS